MILFLIVFVNLTVQGDALRSALIPPHGRVKQLRTSREVRLGGRGRRDGRRTE